MSELKLRPTKQEQKRKPETQNKSYTLQKARGRSHATSRAAARVCRRRSRFLSPPAWGSPTAQPVLHALQTHQRARPAAETVRIEQVCVGKFQIALRAGAGGGQRPAARGAAK